MQSFKYGEFAIIKSQAGLNSYKLSVKDRTEKTNAIGLKATVGRYGGTQLKQLGAILKDICLINSGDVVLNSQLNLTESDNYLIIG